MLDRKTCSIRRLSQTNQHHFFGYYGICPWNHEQSLHLALETTFHDRPPHQYDHAQVGLIDCQTGAFKSYAKTSAFNLQQGSMLHWIDVGYGEEFTYNDWEGNKVISRAIDPKTNKSRSLSSAIAAVSPTEPIAIGLNYARMAACRSDVGYANEYYDLANLEAIPKDDGLWKIDLVNGKSELMLSFYDLAKNLPTSELSQYPHWFNHVKFNTDGSRLLFFFLIRVHGHMRDSLWTINSNGSQLECQIPIGNVISHYDWYSPEDIMLSCNLSGKLQFMSFKDRKKEIAPYGEGLFPEDGHNSFSPDRNWIVCDTYPYGKENECDLLLYNVQEKKMTKIGSFPHSSDIRSIWRCDLHPRWSRDGSMISFDSIHEGNRQIYLVDFK